MKKSRTFVSGREKGDGCAGIEARMVGASVNTIFPDQYHYSSMKIEGNSILITGGATGIGLALTEEFVRRGNEVIIASRNEDNLKKAKDMFPSIHTRRCDLANEEELRALHDWTVSNFDRLNVLVNNAGIQRMIDLRKGTEDLFRHRSLDGEDEIGINFRSYVYATAFFVPELLKREEAAIVNISSGLGFIPMAALPLYSATKAAIHSFTVSLRFQLKDTSIKVFEVIPGIVDTDLDKGARDARGQRDRGIPPAEVARAVLPAMETDEFEVAIGMVKNLKAAASSNFDQVFVNINRGFR